MHTKIVQTINLMVLFKLSHFLVQNMSSHYKFTNVPGQTHSPHFDVYVCVKVADLPKSTYIEKNIKTEFDVYLYNANDNFNDIIQIESFPDPKHVFSLQINKCPQSDTKSPL